MPSLSEIDFKTFFESDTFLKYFKISLIVIGILLLYDVICKWFMYKKAGSKGFYSLIPIYRDVIMSKIANYNSKLTILYYIPLINIFYTLVVRYNVSVRFGFGTFFAIVYMFLPTIAITFLAFKGKYTPLENDKGVVKKNKEFEDKEIDPFKDFKPELKDNAVPFEHEAEAYNPNDFVEIDPNSVDLKMIDSDLVKEEKVSVEDIPDPSVEELKNPNLKKVDFEVETEAYEKPISNEERFYQELQNKKEEKTISIEQSPTVIDIPNGVDIDDLNIDNSNSVLAGIEIDEKYMEKESIKKD